MNSKSRKSRKYADRQRRQHVADHGPWALLDLFQTAVAVLILFAATALEQQRESLLEAIKNIELTSASSSSGDVSSEGSVLIVDADGTVRSKGQVLAEPDQEFSTAFRDQVAQHASGDSILLFADKDVSNGRVQALKIVLQDAQIGYREIVLANEGT